MLSLAVRYTLTGASGATTVPMSRPSATMPAPPAQVRAMMSCCMATRRVRTSGTEATALTALDTCRVRIWAVTSVPSTPMAGLAGVGAHLDDRLPGLGGHRLGAAHRHAVVQHPPGQGAVHGPGVQVAQAQATCDAAGGTGFAGPRGAVHGNDEAVGHEGDATGVRAIH